jgi:hypothetical protein
MTRSSVDAASRAPRKASPALQYVLRRRIVSKPVVCDGAVVDCWCMFHRPVLSGARLS